MIEMILASCLTGVFAGALISPIVHKYISKKLSKRISLSKNSFLRIYLPNGLEMTIWDSTQHEGDICACVNQSDDTKVADGEIVYFSGTCVSKIRGKEFCYDR